MEDVNSDKILKEKLFRKKTSGWLNLPPAEREKIEAYSTGYQAFLDKARTERLCTIEIIRLLEADGFRNITQVDILKPGDRIYQLWKNKTIIACVVGRNKEAFRLIGSHLDSPRLDLKPAPLYEKSNLALLKSHYYGGIKKYQWVNVLLALHGIVYLKNGGKIELAIGQNPGEPQFIIPDLLPHLAKDQLEKKAGVVIEGEDLNIIAGSIPLADLQLKDQIKLNVLKILHDQYGLTEEDFNFAELEFVPAVKPVELGFDRSLIAGYGHDDRSCVYASLAALLQVRKPGKTAVVYFTDKEETGSYGNTGASSFLLLNFTGEYIRLAGCQAPAYRILQNAEAVSGDVSPAQDPNFEDACDPENTSFPGFGITLDKYNGSKGKYGTNDTHAEYMQKIRMLLEKNRIPWQIGELGKVDKGGGGTIAVFLTRFGMDCIDAGPCVLGMHSPCEVVSKFDIYASFRFYLAFYTDDQC